MKLAPSEQNMWAKSALPSKINLDDRAINEKYTRGEGRIIIETNREKLPGFIEQLKRPEYMDLRPFYQRRPRWSVERQSLLVESFIMNIPVPPIFLYEREFNSFEVMDGQQRITAIRDFYENRYALKGLEMWPEINGKTYSTLPDKIKAGIDRRSITSIVMLKESTESEEEESLLRETVFERLNTGGIELGRQEIRNALYSGRFNDTIDKITRWDLFREAWGLPRYTDNEIANNPEILKNSFFSKMEDTEVVLRFFALRHANNYKLGMQPFLDLYMKRAIEFTDHDVDFLYDLYKRTFDLAVSIYGEKLFKPFNPKSQAWDEKPHKAFADAVMIGLSEHLDKENLIKAKSTEIINSTRKLFEDNESGTFTGRKNTKQDIIDRIGLFSKMIIDVVR